MVAKPDTPTRGLKLKNVGGFKPAPYPPFVAGMWWRVKKQEIRETVEVGLPVVHVYCFSCTIIRRSRVPLYCQLPRLSCAESSVSVGLSASLRCAYLGRCSLKTEPGQAREPGFSGFPAAVLLFRISSYYRLPKLLFSSFY